MRLSAYRQYTHWIQGKLGRGRRIPIPACVVTSIRQAYPEESGIYEGFHDQDPLY